MSQMQATDKYSQCCRVCCRLCCRECCWVCSVTSTIL